MKKAILLLSGGIDSPVAGFLASKQMQVHCLHFSLEPFTDSNPLKKSIKACKKLKFNSLYSVKAGKEFQEIASSSGKNYFVLSKRLMFKVAERLCKKLKADCIVSGESIAQVSSQTLSNLSAISKSVRIPIVRPLLSKDKEEIIETARNIGTFEISSGPELCDALATEKPATVSKTENILEEEEKCNMEQLVENSFKKIEKISF